MAREKDLVLFYIYGGCFVKLLANFNFYVFNGNGI